MKVGNFHSVGVLAEFFPVPSSILCLKVLDDAAETKLSNSDLGIDRLSSTHFA